MTAPRQDLRGILPSPVVLRGGIRQVCADEGLVDVRTADWSEQVSLFSFSYGQLD